MPIMLILLPNSDDLDETDRTVMQNLQILSDHIGIGTESLMQEFTVLSGRTEIHRALCQMILDVMLKRHISQNTRVDWIPESVLYEEEYDEDEDSSSGDGDLTIYK